MILLVVLCEMLSWHHVAVDDSDKVRKGQIYQSNGKVTVKSCNCKAPEDTLFKLGIPENKLDITGKVAWRT